MKKRGRSVHIQGVEWQFRIKGGGISIWDPNDKHYHIRWNVFTGWDNDTLERAAWKGYWPKLGPGDIKDWILTHDLSRLCPGSKEEKIPALDETTGWRHFSPDQLKCSRCGFKIGPVGWGIPDHYALKKINEPNLQNIPLPNTKAATTAKKAIRKIFWGEPWLIDADYSWIEQRILTYGAR
jgi:hypothetical protein